MAYDDYPQYVPAAERKRKAQKAAEKLKNQKAELSPVVIEGRQLARTWWGKAWNSNLERYSDYSNRIGRGRSYVRNGAVLDLQIGPGAVTALVQGSARTPYKVRIDITPLQPGVWNKIRTACQGKIESMQELIAGKFPENLAELFTARGKGLFPAPGEITLKCSCPDWAVMCKHVAAVLYGIGGRLDNDPSLFFTLRAVNMEELVSEAVQATTRSMLGKSGAKSRRILDDTDITALFGVEVEAVAQEPAGPKARRRKKKTGKAD